MNHEAGTDGIACTRMSRRRRRTTVTGISVVSWMWRPVGRLREIGWGDAALAALLSLWALALVSGVIKTVPHSGVAASVLVLAMTLPVAWERRAPAAAAAAVAVGAALNELLIGPMVRCGPCLPAVFLIAFFAATRLDGRKLVAAEMLCAGAVTTQAFFDPQLGAGFLVAGLPVVAASCLAGRLARSRTLAAAALRERNAEIRDQREQTARLAVAADRVRVAADLDEFLCDRITAMAAKAAAGRELIYADPAGADSALTAVESDGRATLAQMREVVGTLRADQLTGPQPVLAQLGSLLEGATSADARLCVEGSPRALPAGIELSAYRIVEHLLTALQDAPEARIDVCLRFGQDALELDVAGPASRQADPVAAFAVARERVALLGGTLRIQTGSGRCTALVRLPVTARYASP
jgi:signal transduction histidine kinase